MLYNIISYNIVYHVISYHNAIAVISLDKVLTACLDHKSPLQAVAPHSITNKVEPSKNNSSAQIMEKLKYIY